ncbi:MAG: MBL fold metallo-hydrolase [Spirochaetota bacterium]
MRLFHHMALEGFSNTYVVGDERTGEALVIDPGTMDEDLLMLIESNGFKPQGVLLTRNERHHAGGVKTFTKIYECPVFGRSPPIDQERSREITQTARFEVGCFSVCAIRLPGSWIDGVMYQIADALFPGPMFSAGLTVDLPAGFAKALLIEGLQSVLSSLSPDTFVLPAYGPPTTIRAELQTNLDLRRPPDHHTSQSHHENAPENE